jgi:hypothetical protein
MNDEFAHQHNVPCYQLKNSKIIEVIDGQPIASCDIMEFIYIDYTIGNYYQQLITYIVFIGHYPLILGIPWLKTHNININFAKMDIRFLSLNCLPHHTTITLAPIEGITIE